MIQPITPLACGHAAEGEPLVLHPRPHRWYCPACRALSKAATTGRPR